MVLNIICILVVFDTGIGYFTQGGPRKYLRFQYKIGLATIKLREVLAIGVCVCFLWGSPWSRLPPFSLTPLTGQNFSPKFLIAGKL